MTSSRFFLLALATAAACLPVLAQEPASEPSREQLAGRLEALFPGLGMSLPPTTGRQRKLDLPTDAEIEKIRNAAPSQPAVKPAKPRKVLVFGRLWTHPPTAYSAKTMQILAAKTGAFEVLVSEDPRLLLPESIRQYDVIFMNNLHEREPFLPPELDRLPANQQAAARELDAAVKRSVLEYVRNGGGVAGVHAATAACQNWPEYGEMIGAYYGGHTGGRTFVRNEQPHHPVNAAFDGQDWEINDEIYLFREPYSRDNLRVLLSLDMSRTKDPEKREDKDYAVSWVKPYGKGRVFYCSLGHNSAVYWNEQYLQHVLAGVQFAAGDLDAEYAPLGR